MYKNERYIFLDSLKYFAYRMQAKCTIKPFMNPNWLVAAHNVMSMICSINTSMSSNTIIYAVPEGDFQKNDVYITNHVVVTSFAAAVPQIPRNTFDCCQNEFANRIDKVSGE